VLDDGELIGGTKQRVVCEVMENLPQKTIVYAGPEGGMAQVALAYCGKEAGKSVHVFVQGNESSKPPLSKFAESYGAVIHYSTHGRTLKETQAAADEFIKSTQDSVLMPLGMQNPEYSKILEENLRECLADVKPPKRLWLASGTGFILKILQKVWPDTDYMVVQVGKTIWPDQIRPNDKLFVSPYKFNASAMKQPPYETIPWYDAKIWEFFILHGQSGDYIWNIGRVRSG
jgi:cysteine synthase